MSRSTEGTPAWAPAPVSNSGRSCTAQASWFRRPARAALSIATVTTAESRTGSIAVMIPRRICIESTPSSGRQAAHNDPPARSRQATRRVCPHPTHGSSRGPQTPQYQCSPRRCSVRSVFPQSAQTGGEIVTAPARRNAISRSPTALGAGERPSISSDGESSNA